MTLLGLTLPIFGLLGGYADGLRLYVLPFGVPSLVGGCNLLWALYFAVSRIHAWRDLAGGTFTRYSGPISVRRVDFGKRRTATAYKLVLDGGTLSLSTARGARLSGTAPAAGSVDYATHSHDIFEIRDGAGEVVDRDPTYTKALGAAG